MIEKKNVTKWLSGGAELFLGIPIIGGLFIISNGWTPLVIMFFVHIVGLFFAMNQGQSKIGHIMGIVTSVVGYIPLVGMFMHLVTASVLFYEASQKK